MRCATGRGLTVRLRKQITSLHDGIMIAEACYLHHPRHMLHGVPATPALADPIPLLITCLPGAIHRAGKKYWRKGNSPLCTSPARLDL